MLLLLSSLALASPDGLPFEGRLVGEVYEVVLHEPLGPTFSVDRHDELLELASGVRPAGARSLVLYGLDAVTGQRVPVLDRIPEFPPVPEKEPYSNAGVDNPGAATGSLSGKAVYLSQCHGWLWNGSFSLQRPVLHTTVEDLHNPEGMNQFLTAYLENAGAKVFTVKERDHQTQSAIADNDAAGSGYSESGAGFQTFLDGYGAAPTYAYGVDPFDAGTTRRFPANGGATATWAPAVPADGHYNVYVSWDSDAENATDAHYRITHPGGVIDRYFDQTVHGSTWQYVENLWLTAGSSLTVELVGDSSQANRWLSADAVRIGGGMGIIARGGAPTGRPRWESAGYLGAQYNGAPTSVYDPSSDGDGSDPSSRSRWAKWEHPAGEPAVYVSWHSNAATGTARGTTVYYAGGGADSPHASECSPPAVTGSFTLTDLLQDGIMEQIAGRWDPNWNDRGVNRACFAEVDPSYNDEMPSALIELAFHDNFDDASYLKHPTFRRDVSRGMAKAIIRYFAGEDGVAPAFPPEPPVGVRALHDPGGIRLTWGPGPSGGLDGDAPTGYLVYTSTDGRSWDNGFAVTGTSTVVTPPFASRFYRVVATNAGGQSFPSDVVGVRHSPDGTAPVLIVGAFDRFDRGLLPAESIPGAGTVVRLNARSIDGADIIVPHGRAIADAGWFFDSAADEALPDIDLSAYAAVVWAAGEEGGASARTVDSAQQAILQAYLDQGGTLIVSGSEIANDLGSLGSAADQAFLTNTLGASYVADAASSDQVSGEGVLANVLTAFDDGAYPVEYPDVIAPVDSTVIARYGVTGTGEVAAVMGDSVAVFGFPLDAVGDDADRAAILGALLTELVPEIEPPPVEDTDVPPVDTDEPGVDTDTDEPEPPVPPIDPSVGVNPSRVAISDLGGCGCESSAPAGGLGVVGLVALFARRRR